MPDRLTMPIFPVLWIYPGMIPILHSLGLIMPGQLGPITLVFFWVRSIVPSVMTTQCSSSASRASRMAAAAPGGGT